MRGLIGKKVGMTQVFDADGNCVPVTVIEVGPCTVLRKKTEDGADGYSALVLGFGEIDERKVSKPEMGLFKAAGTTPKRFVKEFRVTQEDLDKVQVGDTVDCSMFSEGDYVDIAGTSKGRGFAGVMKRHNMRGTKRTHGVHEYFRHGGSIGMGTWPGRVIKGKRMAGQMGNARVTQQNVEVVAVDTDENLMMVKGAVPGANNGEIYVTAGLKKTRVAEKKVEAARSINPLKASKRAAAGR